MCIVEIHEMDFSSINKTINQSKFRRTILSGYLSYFQLVVWGKERGLTKRLEIEPILVETL